MIIEGQIKINQKILDTNKFQTGTTAHRVIVVIIHTRQNRVHEILINAYMSTSLMHRLSILLQNEIFTSF